MKLRFAPRAERDLDDIHSYIARENPAAADRVRNAILNKAQIVARGPYLGMQSGTSKTLRSVLASPYQYRIHYSLTVDELIVLHIRHTARRPWSPNDDDHD
jgi:toxin ParE1/3/4